MTVTKSAVLSAAFWHQGICLECGEAFDLEEEDPGAALAACPDCGSDLTVRAETAKLVLDNVEEGEME